VSLLHREVVRLSWWQLRTSRKALIAILVTLAPLVAGILTVAADGVREAKDADADHPIDGFRADLAEPLMLAVIFTALPLTALLLAGGLVSDEIEDRTISYLVVRPVERARLYASKLVPVALAAGVLGALQALSLALARVVSWVLFGRGDREVVYQEVPGLLDTVPTGQVLASLTVGAVLACFLLGAALATLFGFVSLCIPRFHFIANFLAYVAVELPFSQLGGLGLGFLTPTFHALSLVGAFDLTNDALTPDAAPGWVALPLLLAIVAAWAWLGRVVMRKRDFNVTSAAS